MARPRQNTADLNRQFTLEERLEEHARLARAGVGVYAIAKHQGIAPKTAYQDAHRLIDRARERAGVAKLEQMREADAWYRECIADADRLSAVPAQSSTARATHQANKRAAVDSWVKLWGLAKPVQVEHSGPGGGPIPMATVDLIIAGVWGDDGDVAAS